MELTDEQRERIRQNREKALAIQNERRKKENELVQQQHQQQQQQQQQLLRKENEEEEEVLTTTTTSTTTTTTSSSPYFDNKKNKKRKHFDDNNNNDKNDSKNSNKNHDIEDGEEELLLEEFEINASPYVTKQEANQVYCLPLNTIACCTVIREKPNPKNKHFTTLKLYSRNEIRQRAHLRYGGIVGLQQERYQRKQKQYQKDLRSITKQNLFK